MKVFITGGAGFVGSHLTDRLLSQGHSVVVMDNLATGREQNLTKHENLEIIIDSIANKEAIEKCFAKHTFDQVIHAAASYKDPENWEEDALTNVQGTINVVRAAQKQNVKRLIYFQTALCYGLKPEEQPITLDLNLDARGSSYAISKTAAEHYVELSGLNFISFRLANAYGPRNISGPLPTFYKRISEDKRCFVMDTRRDFIYIQDLVDCVMEAVSGKGDSGYYHISSGGDFSIKELYDATRKAMDLAPDAEIEVRERNQDDVFTILIDPSKTNQDMGWKASTPLVEGVAATIADYKVNGIEQTFTHLKEMSTAS